MNILNKIASVTAVFAIVFGVSAVAIPHDAGALNAPRCTLNTIVQPFNNGGTTLSWKVYDAYTITLTDIGSVQDADSVVVYPTSAKTYTLTATGNGGVQTCTATVQAVSNTNPNTTNPFAVSPTSAQNCTVSVSPDLVVPGGTAVLSWNVGSASSVIIDNNIGSVANSGSRVVPYSPVAQTYTVTAHQTNGTQRSCSATVRPAGQGVVIPPTFTGGVNTPSVFVVQTPGVTVPTHNTPPHQPVVAPIVHQQPMVTATYTPPTVAYTTTQKVEYVSIGHLPYTGPNDALYILTLLVVSLGAFVVLAIQRARIQSAFASFSPVDNDDHEIAREEATA